MADDQERAEFAEDMERLWEAFNWKQRIGLILLAVLG